MTMKDKTYILSFLAVQFSLPITVTALFLVSTSIHFKNYDTTALFIAITALVNMRYFIVNVSFSVFTERLQTTANAASGHSTCEAAVEHTPLKRPFRVDIDES